MAWTSFTNLTTPTLPQLDGNFSILSGLTPIPCTAAGVNTITLASIAGAASIAAYANYMRFTGIAASTNNGAVTAQFGSLAALAVYKDTPSGPVALTGSEIIAGNEFILIYDLALTGGAGGFHLKTGASELIGQTVTMASLVLSGGSLSVATINFNSASIAGLFTAGTLNASLGSIGSINAASASLSGIITTGSVNAATGSLSGLFQAASVNAATGSLSGLFRAASAVFNSGSVSGVFSLATIQGVNASLSGPATLGSLVIGGAVTRINSATTTLPFSLIPSFGASVATIAVSGAAINDDVIVGPPSTVPNNVGYTGYVSAAGSVVLNVFNSAAAQATISTAAHRVTAIGHT